MHKDLLNVIFSSLILIVFGWMTWEASQFSELARYFPFYIGLIATVLALLNVISSIRKWKASETANRQPFHENIKGVFKYTGWIIGYIVLIYVLGFILATAVFLSLFLYVEARLRLTRIGLSIGIVLAILLIFSQAIQLYWPQNLLDMLVSI